MADDHPHSYVSPRHRAQRTLELLHVGCRDHYPWHSFTHPALSSLETDVRTDAKVQVTEDIREWDYGDYEGLTSAQIRAQRKEDGIEGGAWDIWRDGCPGGESPQDVMKRLDRLIEDLRLRWHRPIFEGKEKGAGDVLVVAHGHILRAFAMRWIGRELTEGVSLLLEGKRLLLNSCPTCAVFSLIILLMIR